MSPLSRIVIAAVAATALTGADLARAAPAEAGGRLYAIGDSWAAGYGADPIHALLQDAADDLGMTAVVDGEGGSGYLTAPPGTRTYPQRAASVPAGTAADIVVVQGGSNDDLADLGALPAAVDATIEGVHRSLPHAAIVLLGPGPDPWPVTAVQLRVDRIIAAEAGRLHVRYVSPLREGWFTGQDIDTIIDPVTLHPSVAGDEILGARFAADLRPLHHRHPARVATRSGAGAARRALKRQRRA
ncbi:MAG TPA: SGNH/GDSL hydrolase family protein [Amnibacterium sp.]|uniref:SGNH/GDSL hydrolase family protein n=1 Tax=Amnibacterium sp. TaxID=1872496 RepID=UPI002F957EB4